MPDRDAPTGDEAAARRAAAQALARLPLERAPAPLAAAVVEALAWVRALDRAAGTAAPAPPADGVRRPR